MAYWNIRFKSRDGYQYLIQIGGKTGNSDAELLGAAEPFTTEEQDTDDMFTPVLTESGYISIYDNGYDQAGNALNGGSSTPYVMGEQIYLGLNTYLKRKGQGELVTSKR